LVRPGRKVRVREGVTPKNGWGPVSRSSIGTVVSCRYDGHQIVVNFPGEDSTWSGTLAELEVCEECESPVATPIDECEDPSSVASPLAEASVVTPHAEGSVVTPDAEAPVETPDAGALVGITDTEASIGTSDTEAPNVIPSSPPLVAARPIVQQKIQVGSSVTVTGLTTESRAKHNGKTARVVAKMEDKYLVELELGGDDDDEETYLKLEEENLMFHQEEQMPEMNANLAIAELCSGPMFGSPLKRKIEVVHEVVHET
jgi:hypothetical protein